MVTTQTPKREIACQYIKQYADNPYCLELIQFFGRHPGTRFSSLVILHALSANGEKLYLEQALRHLVDKGVVRTYIENNIPLYYLTDVEPLKQAALFMAGMEWHQWQVMLQENNASVFNYLRRQTNRQKPAVTNA